jgi:hypothetical protein
MHLGIIFAVNSGNGETFSLSREVEESAGKRAVYDLLKGEAHLDDESIDSILVVKNGASLIHAPEVEHFWTGRNGDFNFAGLTSDEDDDGYDDDDDDHDEDDDE